MSQPSDPIAQAEVLLAYGRREQAKRILEAALQCEPSRIDLKQRLAAIDPASDKSSELHKTSPRALPILVHAVVAWSLFAGSLFGPAYFALHSARFIAPELFSAMPERTIAGLWPILLFVAVAGIAVVISAIVIFSIAFVAYLKTFVKAEDIPTVESRLHSYIRFSNFEPIYTGVKERLFGL
jgi:hypothetical protein